MKIKKVFVIVPLIVIAVLFCVACTVPANDYDSKIKELEQKIASQQQLIDEMKSNSDGNDEIEAELEKQKELNELYKKQFRNLTGEPIEFTEEAPIFGKKEGDELIAIYDVYNRENYTTQSETEAFEKFFDYCENQLPQKDGYVQFLFKPENDDELCCGYDGNNNFRIYKQGEDYLLEERVIIYDEVFGDWHINDDYYPPDGISRSSIRLDMYFMPVEMSVDFERDLNYYGIDFCFGKTQNKNYFNIYYYNTCIGTCYYDTTCYVSNTGLKDYIFDKIVKLYGDDNV